MVEETSISIDQHNGRLDIRQDQCSDKLASKMYQDETQRGKMGYEVHNTEQETSRACVKNSSISPV
jgi:hypothetical protein